MACRKRMSGNHRSLTHYIAYHSFRGHLLFNLIDLEKSTRWILYINQMLSTILNHQLLNA